MRLWIPVLTLALLTVPIGLSQAEDVLETKRYIVGFYDEFPADRSSYLGEPVVAIDEDLIFFVIETQKGPLFELRATLQEEVRYVEWDNPNYAVLDFVPNDSRYNDAGHYGSKLIKADLAWDRTKGSTAVKVAMIDSGLKKTHEDITGSRVLQGYDFVNSDTDPQDTSGCSYHGSHTTGTAGATINNAKGIAGISQHQILPVRAFSGPISILCSSSTTTLVNSLKYSGDQGAHISSNSWGSSASSTALNDAVTYAYNKGTIAVAAAGNSGPCSNCISYPWKDRDSQVIIVTAVDSAKNQASFSSDGPQSDLAAPGVSILSVDGAGTTGYKTLSGTSMACPHVAGTAALVKALNPSFTFSQVESRLKSTAEDRGAAGEDDLYGAGLVRADSAVF